MGLIWSLKAKLNNILFCCKSLVVDIVSFEEHKVEYGRELAQSYKGYITNVLLCIFNLGQFQTIAFADHADNIQRSSISARLSSFKSLAPNFYALLYFVV